MRHQRGQDLQGRYDRPVPISVVHGGPLAYDDEGTGRAVVLLHAGIADRRMWTPLAGRLAPTHRVVRYDLRGYGESTPPVSSFAHHDDLVGLLDAAGIERATVVGCSFGGAVALDTALAHPDRVEALVLLGSAVSGYRWTQFEELWHQVVGEIDEDDLTALATAEVRFWVVGPTRNPDEVDPDLIAFAEEMDRRALAAEAVLDDLEVRALQPPALNRLGEVRAPALVGAGAADIPEIRQLADRLAAQLPRATRLPDVEGAAHLLPLERPDVVATFVIEFLEACERNLA
jgi:3-oxoadipate enol-lactonase